MRFALVICFLFTSLTSFATSNFDSLRTESRNGQRFIVHEVESKETLYGLSRRYKVSVDDIKSSNPSASAGLRVGEEVFIPIIETATVASTAPSQKHFVDVGETLYSISKQYGISVDEIKTMNNLESNDLDVGQELLISGAAEPPPVPGPNTPTLASKAIHIVEEKETLYSLSKKYNVTVDELKAWNNLNDNNVSVGQQLIVSSVTATNAQPIAATEVKEPDEEPVADAKIEEDTTVAENPEVVPILAENVVEFNSRVVKVGDLEKIFEEGMAMVIENSTDTKKYLALHREADVGTVMKVKNMMNDLAIYVRVVGRLPDTGGNDRLLLKLSRTAYERLGARDQRFPVEVSYIP